MDKSYIISMIKEFSFDDMNWIWPDNYPEWYDKLDRSKRGMAIRSYERWAVNELISYIKKSKKDPIDAIEDFRHKLDDYACQNYIFAIAYDAVTYVLDYVISLTL